MLKEMGSHERFLKQEMDMIKLRVSTNHLARWSDLALLGDGGKTVIIPIVSINYWRKHPQSTTAVEAGYNFNGIPPALNLEPNCLS